MERQFPELFSAPGTARLLRRLGPAGVLELPPSGVIVCCPCQGSLVAAVPLSQPQSLSMASDSSNSCPPSSLRRRAWRAASLPAAVPSCSGAGVMGLCLLVSLGPEGWGLALTTHLHTPAPSPWVAASLSSFSPLSFPLASKKNWK